MKVLLDANISSFALRYHFDSISKHRVDLFLSSEVHANEILSIHDEYLMEQFMQSHPFPNPDDEQWVIQVVKHFPASFQYLSPRLKEDRELIFFCLLNGTFNEIVMSEISAELCDNADFMLEALEYDTKIFGYAS